MLTAEVILKESLKVLEQMIPNRSAQVRPWPKDDGSILLSGVSFMVNDSDLNLPLGEFNARFLYPYLAGLSDRVLQKSKGNEIVMFEMSPTVSDFSAQGSSNGVYIRLERIYDPEIKAPAIFVYIAYELLPKV